MAGEGAHVPQEKGVFGSAESHARSLSQAAASIPGAIGSVPAAVAGAGALAAGMVSQHRSNSGQPDLASVPEEGRTVKQQPEKAPASENVSHNLSSTCTLASGFCTKVTAPSHNLQQRHFCFAPCTICPYSWGHASLKTKLGIFAAADDQKPPASCLTRWCLQAACILRL